MHCATISTAPGEGHGAQIAVWCLLLIIIIIASAGWRQDDLRAILSSILSRCKWVACLLATFSRMYENMCVLLRYGMCGYCAFAVPSLSLFSCICVFVLRFFVSHILICAPCLFASSLFTNKQDKRRRRWVSSNSKKRARQQVSDRPAYPLTHYHYLLLLRYVQNWIAGWRGQDFCNNSTSIGPTDRRTTALFSW